ncbi:MAG: sensor histidine kinase [Eubacteriales bacterium]|nr:sensor histidine kinase [Eubacteriales bacterium]
MKRRRFKYRLLLSYGLIIFLTISLLTALTMIGYTEIFQREVGDLHSQMLQQLNANIESSLEFLSNMAVFVSYNNTVHTFFTTPRDAPRSDLLKVERDAKEELSMVLNYSDDLAGIQLFRPDTGNYLYSDKWLPTLSLYDFPSEQWYQSMMREDVAKVLYLSYEKGAPARYNIARKVYNLTSRKLLGVIVINCKVDVIGHYARQYEIAPNGFLCVLDEAGPFYTFGGAPDPAAPEDILALRALPNGTYTRVLRGEAMRVSVFHSPLTEWTFLIATPLSFLFRGTTSILWMILLASGFMLLITTITTELLSRSISKPLEALTKHMLQVMQGAFHIRLPVRHNDEIGQMTFAFNQASDRLQALIQTVYEAELKQRDAQLSALQSQINPHFLYNTLESIKTLAVLNDDYDVAQMIIILGKYLSFSIDNRQKTVTLSEELEHLHSYISIFRIRNDSFHYEEEIADETLNKWIVKISLQPIVENCFMHGLFGKRDGRITLRAWYRDQCVHVEISDNGIGIGPDKLDEIRQEIARGETRPSREKAPRGHGVGLASIHARLRLLFGEKSGLFIHSVIGHGVTVTLLIPDMQPERETKDV